MKKQILIIIAAVLSLLIFSCKGAVGPAGPAGAVEPAGWHVATYQRGVSAYDACYDVRIRSNTPATNYGSDGASLIGVQNDDVKRLIIEYYVSDLPAGAVIEKATISLKALDLNVVGTGNPVFTMYEMATSWFENETTWNNAVTSVAWTNPGGDFTNTAVSNSVTVDESEKWYTWSLKKELIQEKIESGTTYGFIMKGSVETGTTQAEFAMSENATVADRPVLTIYYSLP